MNAIPKVSSVFEFLIPLVKEFEGFRTNAYWDGSQWSIGFGSGTFADGKKVTEHDVVTMKEAIEMLEHDLVARRLPAIEKLVKVPLTPQMTAALASFCYNKGVGGFTRSSILAKLNAGESKEVVAEEFAKYDKNAAGKQLRGLARRRAAEAKLFLS